MAKGKVRMIKKVLKRKLNVPPLNFYKTKKPKRNRGEQPSEEAEEDEEGLASVDEL